ncbi:MAG: hypothetical protein OXU92_01240, partial [Deltaproteobacteria bacterium]|nr:hypothetical protein [Deltaproteobacteria bacterium]
MLFAAVLFAVPFAAQRAQAQSPVTLRIEWSNPTSLGFGRSEGSPANFTVRFTEGVVTTAAVQVDWTISFPAASASVTPAAAADFSSTTGTVTIPAGMNSVAFSITPTDELVGEPLETYIVTLSTPRGGGAGVAPGLHATLSSVTARIDLSDRVIVGWRRIGSGAVTEKNSATFRFSLTIGGVSQTIPATSGGPICVKFSTTVASQRMPRNNADSGPDLGGITDCDGNAVNIADENSSANGGVLIPAGRQTYDFSIRARFDGLDETGGNEEMVVELTSDEERAGAGTVSLTRTALRTIRVPIANFNNLHNFAFTNPVTSINEGAAATTYTVTRTGPEITGASGITITWAYAAGSLAPAATDFSGDAVPPGGTLVFTGMDTTKTFSITTKQDSLNEANETFTLALSVASEHVDAANTAGGATLPSDITVTIVDDDPITATLSGGGSVAEGANATVTVTLSGGTPTADVTLNYTLGADSDNATVNADTATDIMDSGSGSFTIATTDSAPHTFNIATVDDALNEAPEVFLVNAGTVSSAGTASAAGSPQTFTITDGDDITASIARAGGQAATVDEGQAAEFTVTLTGATSGSAAPITVNYTASGTTDTPTDANSGSIEIAAGGTTGDIRLVIPRSATLVDSSPNETLTVTLGAITVGAGGGAVSAASSPGNAASVTVNYLTAFHRFAFTNPVTSISEGAAATTYTVTRTGPQITGAAGVTITWAYAAGSPAPAAADFSGDAVPPGGTLVFMGTDASKTFSITTKEDSLNEANERFTLTLSVASGDMTAVTAEGGAALPSPVAVAIADDDPITATLSGGGNVAEGSNATVTVTLSGGTPTADVKLNYNLGTDTDDATVNAAAADTMDGGNGSFTISTSDSAPHTFNIAAVDDAINEASEVFLVNAGTVSSAGAISTAGSPRTFTITDGDSITVSIAPPNPATVNEGESVNFSISLAGATSGSVAPITVNYTVSGTTDTPTDANSGSIQIAASGTTGTITLGIPLSSTLNADSMAETLSVTLGAITVGAGGGTASAAASPGNKASVTVSYLTGDHIISFTNPVTSIVEGGSATYTVTRSGPAITSGASIELNWVYAAGSPAPAANDFMGGAIPAGGQLTFTGSETSKTFTITTAEDTVSEPGEVFTLSLSATRSVRTSEGGVDLPAAITVTIGESDRPVTLQVAVPTLGVFGFFEGTSANNKFVVSFPESVTTTAPVEVNWAISFPARTETESSASAADFSTTSGTASIPAGQRTVDVPVSIVNENVNESNERFTITISNPSGGGAIAVPSLHATLDSVDSFIGANDASRVQFISSQRGTVRRSVREGSAIAFVVEHIGRGGVRGISDGAICVGFNVDVFSQQTPANTAQSGPDISGITDCDGNAVSVSDDGGQGTGGVLIPAGQQTASFSILARFDDLDEGSSAEELLVELVRHPTPRVGATTVNLFSSATRSESRVNIVNANYLHNFTFTSPPTSIAEGAASTFTVARSGPEIAGADGITITWAYAAGSPAASVSDFTGGAPGGTLVFTGTETSETFSITAADDNLNESDERFTLTLSVAAGDMAAANAEGRANLPDPITVSVTDGDDITVSIARANGQAATVDEGQSAAFTVTLNGATNGSAGAITVAYTASGTTDTPTDANSGSIEIAAGRTTGAITLGIPFSAALDADSPDETLRVTLGAITVGAGGGTASAASSPNNAASVTVNYVAASHNFSFSNPAASIDEGVATTYTVARTGPNIPGGSSITITWAYAASSPAPAAADFTGGAPSGGTLVFTGSETSETFSITAADDTLNEATERFTLTLSIASGDLAAANTAGGANLPSAITVAITDGDPITATLSGGGNVAEGSNAVVTVTLSGGTPTADVVLNYTLGADSDNATVNADTATDIMDSGSGSFTIATTDSAPHTFNIATVDDALNEAPEVFLVNAGTVSSAGAISTAGSPQTFTITDGDD